MNTTPEPIAWDILREAEGTDFLMSMAEDRAACGNFRSPTSLGDYLFWFEDEAEIQEAQAETYPDEAEKRLRYAAVLREVADRLRELGYEPSIPKKETPIVQIHPLTQVKQVVTSLTRLKQAVFDFTPPGG